MCGIIGFSGTENAVPKLMQGLSALEYRGYDSAGIAYFENGSLRFVKEKGRLDKLQSKINAVGVFDTTCGIGHTRWATHGAPSDVNSHPHGTENVLIVHNGIIENYAQIKSFLISKGYVFKSDTDTETAAKLIDYHFTEIGEPIEAVRKALNTIEGSYAVAALFSGHEGKIFAFRKDNPLIAAPSLDGIFITSDISAVLKFTNKYYEISEGEIAVADKDGITFVSSEGNIVQKELQTALWSVDKTEKCGFEHFMIKEIHEEPEALVRTLSPLVYEGNIAVGDLKDDDLRQFEKIHIVACGTAYHAGLIGKVAIESLARLNVNVYYASEFRYINPILGENDLVIAISQSGETADTLAALRLAKLKGVRTLAIVNNEGSALAREAYSVFYTKAGPEISVASTKAYHVQLGALYLIALKFAGIKGTLAADEISRLTHALVNDVPDKIRETLDHKSHCEYVAKKYMNVKNMFFIGRGVDRAQCEEAALKVKEISYIHCEAYAAGELKHGTISLIEDGTPVVAIITSMTTADKMISNIEEVKARGAKVILFVTEGLSIPSGIANDIIYLSKTEEIFMPFICGTSTQLMAYYMSLNLGHDVDKPRNLAKSVTVE